MRVTTNMMMTGYRNRLNGTMDRFNQSMMKAMTQRKFLRGSEDPAAATLSYKFRREMQQNDDYLTNVEAAASRNVEVESAMRAIADSATTASADILSAINGTMGKDERVTYATKLRELQKTMVLNANAKIGDDYLFGGTSTKTPPFSIDDVGEVIYKNLNVNTGYNNVAGGTGTLDQYANEKMYIDLGFGMNADAAGNVADNSAYNISTPGINFLGYGEDADGDPKNIIQLLGDAADMLESDAFSYDDFKKYIPKISNANKSLMNKVTQLGTNSEFLKATKTRLEASEDNYNNKIDSVEYMTLDEAITLYMEENYTYMAALKIGSNVLSPSFIDFMK